MTEKRLKDFNDAKLVAGRWCIEFDGTPKTVEMTGFYPSNFAVLGSCFYECWTAILPGGGSGDYDWSDGISAAHAMLRNPVNGNFIIGSAITAATNASPIAVTTLNNVPFITGDTVNIGGVLGNTAANGTFVITKTGANTFTLNGSTGNGAYTSGGAVEGPAAFGSTGSLSFGADDIAYNNQWHHSASGVDVTGGAAVQYYDGVPVGYATFTGNRVVPLSSNLNGYMGGSDHNNAIQRISQYRIFENGSNPRTALANQAFPYIAFPPEMVFGGAWLGGVDSPLRASALYDFFQPGGQIGDKGQGLPAGTLHTGRPKGFTGGSINNLILSTPPIFVIDETVPNPETPVQPAGKAYTPSAVPASALVFDSIQRKNATLAFNGIGGMGSTEGGSKGVLVWNQALGSYPNYNAYPFGILNEQFVYLQKIASDVGGTAWIEVGQANQDIRVSRKASQSYNCGVSTSILFRYKDANNYWYAFTHGTSGGIGTAAAQKLFVGKVIAGVKTQLHRNVACPASWTTLRVTTKSTGAYEVFCDATSVVSGSVADHQSETKSGIIALGDPQNYGFGTGYYGLTHRWRNFTIFDNP
jgi:hypothetical protein